MLRSRVSILIFGGLLAAVAAACGNPATAPQQTQTAQAIAAVSATPAGGTPAPLATPPSPPQVSGAAPSAPVTVVPLAAGVAGARTDCPAGFATWRDALSTVSVCAPSWLEGRTGVDNFGASLINLGTPPGSPSPDVFLSLQITPNGTFQDPTQVAKLCAAGLVPAQTSGEEVHVAVAGLSALGCHVIGEPQAPAGPLELTSLTAPLPATSPARYLNVLITWRTQSTGAKALVDQVLATVRLGP